MEAASPTSGGDDAPVEGGTPSKSPPRMHHPYRTPHESASKELRLHEMLALLSCFLFPLLGAYLLHTIRGQLSRPSEGLVSDYNLTIFILASEVRPLAHLIKIIQSRTLFLQRMVNKNPYVDGGDDGKDGELRKRLDELEARVVSEGSARVSGVASASNKNAATVTTEVRRTLQPDLDALNRAVRRYEKRATMQTMQTESRLVDLEMRLNDALSLAAAAAQSGQRSRHGFATILTDWICAAVVLPLQALWALLNLPVKAGTSMISMIGAATMGTKKSRERRSGTSRSSGHGRLSGERLQARGLKKG